MHTAYLALTKKIIKKVQGMPQIWSQKGNYVSNSDLFL